ncbi:hypothetical protein C8Q76DRAFT_694790 [Earliella scabrosa]|nr:hypothetical protein C8Q76DRAFT_694790 [Earliella scabrosa]
MPRQTEVFFEPEKEFLREKCQDPVVKAVLRAGGFNCLNAANLVWDEYLQRFPDPFPEEDQDAWETRLGKAGSDRRPELSRRPEEDAAAVQARLEGRLERIRKWFKRNWRQELGEEADTPVALPIPPLKIHKPKRISAYDIFRKSDLKRELVEIPYTSTGKVDVGKLTTRIKTAFDGLNETQHAHFQTLADIANAARHAQQLQDHGSETELERARMIPSIQSWVQQVLEHLQKNVHWIGGMVLGGPDEDGELKVRSACTGVDSQGRDFLVALCERIGWTPEQFNAFVAFWMYDAHRRRQTRGVTLADMQFDRRDVAEEYLRAHHEAGQTNAPQAESTSAVPRASPEYEQHGPDVGDGGRSEQDTGDENYAGGKYDFPGDEDYAGGKYDFPGDEDYAGGKYDFPGYENDSGGKYDFPGEFDFSDEFDFSGEFDVVGDDDVTFDWSFLSAYTDNPAPESAQEQPHSSAQTACVNHPPPPDDAQSLNSSSGSVASPTDAGPLSHGLDGAIYPEQYSPLLDTTLYQLGDLDLASSSEALTSYGDQSLPAIPQPSVFLL